MIELNIEYPKRSGCRQKLEQQAYLLKLYDFGKIKLDPLSDKTKVYFIDAERNNKEIFVCNVKDTIELQNTENLTDAELELYVSDLFRDFAAKYASRILRFLSRCITYEKFERAFEPKFELVITCNKKIAIKSKIVVKISTN